MPSVLTIIRLKLNDHSYSFLLKKSFQVKNENKTLIQAFPLIFKDQYLEIFGQSIHIIIIFEKYHKLNTNINHQYSEENIQILV